MDVSNYHIVFPICLTLLIIVSIGLGYDLWTGTAYVKPGKFGPCVHCGRDYHDHEAKHHYCPKKGWWSDTTFKE